MNISHRPKVAAVWGLLALLVLGFVLLLPFSATHLDHSRDMRAAAEIAEGVNFPLIGPKLAGLFYIGPLWYYLLGGLRALGLDYLGTTVALAMLGALQFPLAYLAGKRWAGRRAGLIWAGLLVIPSWSMFEQVLPGHPLLSGVTVTAMLWFALRYLKQGRSIDFIAVALAFSLALHAQLSNLPLVAVPLVCLAIGWRRHQLSWRAIGSAGLVAALPFVPLLIYQWQNDWPLVTGVAHYWSGDQGQSSLASTLPLLWQATGGGLHYWLETIIGWPRSLALGLAAGFTVLCAVGVAGAVMRAWWGDRLTRVMLISLAVAVILLPLIRSYYVYYMVTGLRMLLLGVVAVGLAEWMRGRRLRAASSAAIVVIGLVLYGAGAAAVIKHQYRGSLPFAFYPLFNIVSEPLEHHPHAFMPAYGMRASGRWLCDHPEASVHGAYGQSLVLNYAVEARLVCGHERVRVGGHRPDGEHWVGLSHALLANIGVSKAENIGNFGLLSARPVADTGVVVELPGQAAYPPFPSRFGAPETRVLSVALAAGERLAVTHLSFGMSSVPEISVRCGTREIPPLAGDNVSWVFGNDGCDEALRLELASPDLEHLDVVVF